MDTTETTSCTGILVQDNISITVRPTSALWRSLLLLCIAAMGYIGTIGASLSMFTPVYDRKTLLFTAALLFAGYSVLSLLPFKRTGWIPPLTLAGGALYLFSKRSVLVAGFQFFYNHLYQNIYHTEILYYRMDAQWKEAYCTTFFLGGCLCLLACFLCWFTIRRPLFLMGFLITFLPIEVGLYNGLEMSMPTIALVLLYWTALMAIQLTSLRYTQAHRDVGFFRKGNQFTAAYTLRATVAERCGIITALLTALVFLLSWGLVTASGIMEKPDVQSKRKELKTSLQAFDAEDMQESVSNIGAAIGLGNTVQTQKLGKYSSVDIQNQPQLKLTLQTLPNAALYLKSFTGTEYENNAWKSLDESVWKKQENLSFLAETYGCPPQLLPYQFQNGHAADAISTIKISALKWERRCYVPYAAYNDNVTYQADYQMTAESKKNYTFQFSVEQNFLQLLTGQSLVSSVLPQEMFNMDDAVTTQFLEALEIPGSFDSLTVNSYFLPENADGSPNQQNIQAMLTEQYVYRPFVYETYTEPVDTDALQAVYESLPETLQMDSLHDGISEDHLKSGSGETLAEQLTVLNAIRSYLSDQAVYTTSPGKTPGSRDFVNYFLLENQQGYCTHFATAGVLLARYFGIPARYCEGYVATPTDYDSAKKQKDGSFTVTLTDARAHAWCEFYVTGYGWIPFEFTPGYYGGAAPPEPEVTTTTTQETTLAATKQTTTIQTQTVTKPITTMQTTLHTTVTGNTSTENDTNVGGVILKILGILLLIAAIAAMPFLLRYYRITRRKHILHGADRKKAILELYRYLEMLLALRGIVPNNQPILAFAKMASERLTELQLPSDQIESFCLLVTAVDMGGQIPSEAERTKALQTVQSLAAAMYEKSTPLQKLYLKYIKHLI